MSSRPGSQQFNSVAAQTLGVAAGRTIPLGNGNMMAALSSLFVTYVATATAGSRIPIFRIIAPASQFNPTAVTLWQVAFAAVTVSQTSLLFAGSGVPPSTVAAPLSQYVQLPLDLPIPPNAQVQIFDNANIDTNDTIALVANLSM